MAARLLSILCLTLSLAPAPAAALPAVSPLLAQLSVPSAAPAPAITGLDVEGIYETAPVLLDGAPIIRLGALVDAPVAQLPLATRITDVETALGDVIAQSGSGPNASTVFDPKSLRIHVKREGDVAVIEAVDGKHPDPLPIVTVTGIDAHVNDAPDVDTLAAQWQSTLQSALVGALDLRQPAAEKRNVRDVIDVAGVLVVASVAGYLLLRTLWKRMETLEGEIAQRDRTADIQTPPPGEAPQAGLQRRRSFALALRNLEPVQRLRVYGAGAETLVWALTLAWFVGITWGLSLFATTTPLAQAITHSAFGVATTIIVTGLLNRLLDVLIARTAAAWRLRRLGTSDDRARLLLRVPTIARAIAGAKTFALLFVAALSVLGQIGVPIGSVVTIGGLAAIALSLAAQNFVRDFLNGFLVLFEDQYVVGDYVTINAFSGSVERLTLRMVQIRDAAGDLITIPHSSVVNVVNQSRNWSRIDYRIAVDAAADVERALSIVRTEIEALLTTGDWTAGIGTPIEWSGIDALTRDGVTLRISIRTAPLRQFELRRLINERIRSAFVKDAIALGTPAVPS
jgi:small conductance mechanosensitive channel